MITPMNQFEVLLTRNRYRDFMQIVSDAGMAHYSGRNTPMTEEWLNQYRQWCARQQLIERWDSWQASVEIRPTIIPPDYESEDKAVLADISPPDANSPDALERLSILFKEWDALTAQSKAIADRMPAGLNWADWPQESMERLDKAEIQFALFEIPPHEIESVNSNFIELDKIGERIRCIGFGYKEPPPARAGWKRLDSGNLNELARESGRLQQQRRVLAAKLHEFSRRRSGCVAQQNEQAIHLGWSQIETKTEWMADGQLVYANFFVPRKEAGVFREMIQQFPCAWQESRPSPSSDAPVLLQNTAVVRPFETIGELFSLPKYGELDLTPFFAPFFALFFGMCLNDVGYALLVLAAGVWIGYRGTPRYPIFMAQLLVWFGVVSLITGLHAGSFFGWDITRWRELEDLFGTWRLPTASTRDWFTYALVVGWLQILFAMGIRLLNRLRMYSPIYCLSAAGWLLLFLGLTALLVPDLPGDLRLISTPVAVAGASLIVLFAEPERKPMQRIALGLWELYGMTGLLGDLLSYVRLFALGISGASLGLVVNQISQPFFEAGSLTAVAGVMIWLAGHALNFSLSLLGSVVHPIRLTFVEFYKNAGFSGGGRAFIPFELLTKPQEP